MSARIAVLASGGGSNLQAIFEHLASRGDEPSRWIRLVASDRAGAGALERARARGIESLYLDLTARVDGLAEVLHSRSIDLVVLAGYLRMVPEAVTTAWRGRIVNVHPALLPSFGGHGMYGRRVHEAVLASGARVSGVTVHFVDSRYDQGPIIAQWPVPVYRADTPDSLAQRVLAVEHQLYPRVIEQIARGRITLVGDEVSGGAHAHPIFPHYAASDEPGAADAWDSWTDGPPAT
jgi:formyltetrahydrofolate-dependent phosphoribosylglycinamide formyltransferase